MWPSGGLIEEEAVGGGDLVAEGLDGGREAPVRRLEVGCGADRGGVVGCGAEIPAEIDLTPSPWPSPAAEKWHRRPAAEKRHRRLRI